MDIPSVFTDKETRIIEKEFERLNGVTYLDHTGSCLYPKSLIEAVSKDLCSNTYSNPHSNSTCSKATSDAIDQIRFRILKHFNTDGNEYSVIFTSGATAALKLVAESFNWTSSNKDEDTKWFPKDNNDSDKKGKFVYLNDSHTSVLGMRNIIEDNSVSTCCLTFEKAFSVFSQSKIPEDLLSNNLSDPNSDKLTCNSMFVYPAQCNFSGFKYPLEWIHKTHEGYLNSFSSQRSNWYCLLDAATYLSTSSLDLSLYKPDFICLSFYKIFGYPTGLGALLVKNSSAHVLTKQFYGGGTVHIALSDTNKFVPRNVLHDKFEDGTLNFLSIISLHHCFNTFHELVGSMDRVSRHSFMMGQYAFTKLLKLHHSNGRPAVELYTDTCFDDIQTQGSILSFNLIRSNGEYIGFVEVLHQANLHNIQLRTGCFCNSGACWRHLNLTQSDVQNHYQAGHVCGDDMDIVNGQATGCVRISFSYYTTHEHIDSFIKMIDKCFVLQPSISKIPCYWPEKANMLKQHHRHSCTSPKVNKVANNMKPILRDLIGKESLIKTDDFMDLKISSDAVISRIFLYPVKSCGALSVSSWILDSKGLMYDRMFMIVTETGAALTQKRQPNMCLIKPNIDIDANKLILTFEDSTCSVDLDLEEDLNDYSNALCESKVCGDRIQGYDCGDTVSSWISTVLDIPGLRLVRQHSRSSKKSALTLANLGQYLLVSRTSVDWLSQQISSSELCKDSFIDRFRSNFVIDNVSEPFVEQMWSQVTIGKCQFKVDGGCNRCHMICIDQSTGVSNQEPLTALGAAMKGKLKFGIYLSKLNTDNVKISVGDKVEVK